VNIMKYPHFIVFPGSVEQRYGLMVDTHQPHNTPSVIKNSIYFYLCAVRIVTVCKI
jgi:hypothetical protein